MSFLRHLASGIRALLRKRESDRELDDELRAYLEASAADKMKSGLARDEAFRAARLGVFLGVGGSVALARFFRALVFVGGRSVTDPLTFALVAVTLVLVALAASYIPARRAMRVDPLTALRHE